MCMDINMRCILMQGGLLCTEECGKYDMHDYL